MLLLFNKNIVNILSQVPAESDITLLLIIIMTLKLCFNKSFIMTRSRLVLVQFTLFCRPADDECSAVKFCFKILNIDCV